jgi:hypothetical protein
MSEQRRGRNNRPTLIIEPRSTKHHLVWKQRADVVIIARANIVDAGKFSPNAEYLLVNGERNLVRGEEGGGGRLKDEQILKIGQNLKMKRWERRMAVVGGKII